VLALLFGQASNFLALQITDETEQDLPVEKRPSWRLWQLKRLPIQEVHVHAQKFPSRRSIRMWWLATITGFYAFFLAGLLALIVRSLTR
jgi:hypothetical protein